MAKVNFGPRQRLAVAAAALLAAGAAGGAGAVALTRPSVEMAPTIATPIAKLPATAGIVTVKGRVAEVFGDRFVVQDGSGRAMIDAGRNGGGAVATGSMIVVQGRYDDGQLRAHFLVGPSGQVEQVGPAHEPHGHGPRGHDAHGHFGQGGPGGPGPRDGDPDGPPPPAAGPDGAPLPPPPAASGPVAGTPARPAVPAPAPTHTPTTAPVR